MAMVHGVRAVHGLHVWTLTSEKRAMSSYRTILTRLSREIPTGMRRTVMGLLVLAAHSLLSCATTPGGKPVRRPLW